MLFRYTTTYIIGWLACVMRSMPLLYLPCSCSLVGPLVGYLPGEQGPAPLLDSRGVDVGMFLVQPEDWRRVYLSPGMWLPLRFL